MAITFVQAAQVAGLNVTMTNFPTVGNVMIAYNWNQSAVAGIASGWTNITSLNATTWSTRLVYKVVTAADAASKTVTPTTTTSGNVSVIELNSSAGPFATPLTTFESTKQGTSANPPTVTSTGVTATSVANFMVLACFANIAADPAPTAITGMTIALSLTGGTTGTGALAYEAAVGTSAVTKACTWTGSTAGIAAVIPTTFLEIVASPQTGSITPASSLLFAMTRALTGSITAAGVLVRQTQRALSGVIAAASSLVTTGTIMQALSGSISPVSSQAKITGSAISGSVTASGAAVLAAIRALLSGSITPASALSRAVKAVLTGSITAVGTLIFQLQRALSGAVTAASSIIHNSAIDQAFTGSITAASSMARATVALLAGSITAASSVARKTFSLLVGSVTPHGALAKLFKRAIAGSITAAGSIAKAIGLPLSGSITAAGSLTHIHQIIRALSGAITAVGSLQAAAIFKRALAGTITVAGSIRRQIQKVIAGIIAAITAISGVKPTGVVLSLPIVTSGTMGLSPLVSETLDLPIETSVTLLSGV